jgi:hypothetical protein
MPDEKSATAEVGEGLRSIFERVGEFFHLFDLSFLVSGATTFGALAFFYIREGAPQLLPFDSWVQVASLIIVVYVCGLLSFAVGRWINTIWFRRKVLASSLERALVAHDVVSPSVQRYLAMKDNDGLWPLYVRMWAELAHKHSKTVVFHHLSRYWAMAATYDGIGASFLVWAIVSLLSSWSTIVPHSISTCLAWTSAAIFIALAVASFRRGASFFQYQVEDLVAGLAARRQPLVG